MPENCHDVVAIRGALHYYMWHLGADMWASQLLKYPDTLRVWDACLLNRMIQTLVQNEWELRFYDRTQQE